MYHHKRNYPPLTLKEKFVSINTTAVFDSLKNFISADIAKFQKPMYCYYYHHRADRICKINYQARFLEEFANLDYIGFTLTGINHDMNIMDKIWPCDIIIAQLFDIHGILDMTNFDGMSVDPLGESLGLLGTGFYYITFPER